MKFTARPNQQLPVSKPAERTYHTQDKSDWGPGSWTDEPDKISFTDEETGYPCLIVRNHNGALCGYVGVEKGHPAYRKNYNDVNVDVHGGLTYSDFCQDGPEDTTVCHIPEHGKPDHIWWQGFDTAHCWDVIPAMNARYRKLYEETKDPVWLPLLERATDDIFPTTYKDVPYVRAEVLGLAQQLKTMEASLAI
jgi:hypothetical protein